MTKKTNTLLFILAATVFNIVTFFLVFCAFMFLFFLFASRLASDEGSAAFAAPIMIIIFIGSIALSFVIYRLALNFFLAKVDIEEFMEPLFFVSKKRKKLSAEKNEGEIMQKNGNNS